MNETHDYEDRRWDIHTERMASVAKAGIGAITLLNSGSWIALLSQAEGLSNLKTAKAVLPHVMLYWGMGAFLGTMCWLFFYWSASAQYRHDMNRTKKLHMDELAWAFWLGLVCALSAMALFAAGVFRLTALLT